MKVSRKLNSTVNSSIKSIGMFEGISADAEVTNHNGLDITRDVWEVVFDSDEYKTGIENGWYIGFLGHPKEPDCMDFEHACIVMTEGHIDESGKVYGTFRLLDTPVGRIVKTFIDGGVKFGISVRGAGDIINNSVDPETFVFRGFDLVTFPAYDEAVPEFQNIAASTDSDVKAKYRKVCSAVNKNLPSINSYETIDVLQSQFAPQSKEYKAMESRKIEILANDIINIEGEKVEGLTQLYLEALSANQHLTTELESIKKKSATEAISAQRKINSIERILGSQLEVSLKDKDQTIKSIKASYDKLSTRSRDLGKQITELNSRLHAANESNLIYKQKIEAHSEDMCEKDAIISSLQSNLDETVKIGSRLENRSSNLGEKIKDLKADIRACNGLIKSYQTAYAEMYANALGISLGSLPIKSSTTVSELQSMISGGTNTSNISSVFVEPFPVDLSDDEDGDDIVTI